MYIFLFHNYSHYETVNVLTSISLYERERIESSFYSKNYLCTLLHSFEMNVHVNAVQQISFQQEGLGTKGLEVIVASIYIFIAL